VAIDGLHLAWCQLAHRDHRCGPRYLSGAAGTLDISTAGSDYDTALGVYTGSRGALEPVTCNDDADGALTSHVVIPVTAGTTYYVLAVAAWSSPPGTLQLSVSLTPPLTLKLGYDPQAVVDEQTGVAVVTGAVTCSRSVKTTITVSIGQQLGNSGPRTGVGKGVVSCSTKGTSRFSITVASTSTPGLSDGPASVRLVGTGCDALGCAKTTTTGDLQLVKKLK
jgi:hypothetical protein